MGCFVDIVDLKMKMAPSFAVAAEKDWRERRMQRIPHRVPLPRSKSRKMYK